MTEVGRVVALFRYPVKSMAPEPLDAAEVSWHGVAGDRRYAFVREGLARSGFPWLTLRERPEMGHFRPRFADPGRPDGSPTLVRTPGGEELEVVDPALADALGGGVRVLKQDRGVFDTLPLSLICTASVGALGGSVGRELEVLRFRPNLVVEAACGTPFAEDGWVGRTLRAGTLKLRLDQRDRRCAVIGIDPATTERDPAVLRTLARERDACIGVYGSTVEPGRVAVGDPVVLEP